MKSVLHAVTVYHMVACGDPAKVAPYRMCQLSCHRLRWTMRDPYEKQLLMIAVQNASCVGRLRGDGLALAPPLPCSIRAVAHAVVKP